eukprot:2683032-Pyramimonas_sp.AAC.1
MLEGCAWMLEECIGRRTTVGRDGGGPLQRGATYIAVESDGKASHADSTGWDMRMGRDEACYDTVISMM